MAVPAGALFLWEGQNVASPPLDGAVLVSMVDQSGSANDATQSTGSLRGVWRATGVAGKPAVELDGVDDRYHFSAAGLNIFRNKLGGTIAAVTIDTGSLTSSAERPVVWFSRGGSPAVRAIKAHAANATAGGPMLYRGAARRLDGDTAQLLDASQTTANPAAETFVVDWANGDAQHYLNGALDASKATFTSAGATSDTASQSAQVGANSGLTTFFKGPLAFVALYDRVLSDADLAQLHDYLVTNYVAIKGSGAATASTTGAASGVPVATGTGAATGTAVGTGTGVPVAVGTGSAKSAVIGSATGVPIITGTARALASVIARALAARVVRRRGTLAAVPGLTAVLEHTPVPKAVLTAVPVAPTGLSAVAIAPAGLALSEE
jgi:hypothetical protein